VTRAFTPTPEQLDIIEAAADVRRFVVAPAGSGKTEVLRARIAHLIEQEGLSAGSDVLVLSFSRAAVGEMKRRLRAANDAASFARCQTFDSYATRLLAEWAPEELTPEADFDDRIRRAVDLLGRGEEDSLLGPIRHVLVDEVQDLVGDRAALVLALLEHADCGFTLFGDPAQSIYEFQLEESRSKMTSAEFARAVRQAYPELVESRLDKNYRAQSDIAKAALGLGSIIVSDELSDDDVLSEVIAVLGRVPEARLAVALPRLKSAASQAAILCRYNSQVLEISNTLRASAVPHRIQARAVDRAIARWVACCLSDYSGLSMPRSVFEERFSALSEVGLPNPDSAWRCMRRIGGMDKRAINLDQVHMRVALGDVPDELTAAPESSLVVSTIYRAKGLEFDDVYVVNPAEWMQREEEPPSGYDNPLVEARLAYVALTRARNRMIITEAPDTGGMKCRGNPGGRWIRRYQPRMTNDVEVRGCDTDWEVPAGALGDPSLCLAIQEYIRDEVRPGDPLCLVRRDDGPSETSDFDLVHDGLTVGASSKTFDRDFRAILRFANNRPRSELPLRIEGLAVESVDTVAGFPAIAQRCGFGRAAIWLRVRAVGLGHLVWREN